MEGREKEESRRGVESKAGTMENQAGHSILAKRNALRGWKRRKRTTLCGNTSSYTIHTRNQSFSFRLRSFVLLQWKKAIFEGVSINNSPSSPGHLMNSKKE